MLVLDDATFLHNPKAAGSSIKTWLYEATGKSYKDIIGSPHVVDKSRIRGFTFCCVRNPYQKIISSYEYLQRFGGGQFSAKNFEDFVDNFTDERMWPFNLGQSYYAKHCDYILRFENLDDDFKTIQEHFNCDKPLSVINDIEYDKYNWKQYYTQQTKLKVEKLYKEDIDLFGYEF